MPSLTKRAAILVVCRLFNQGVLLLSPVLLVRIFTDQTVYGQYREFIMYAVLIGSFIDFSMNSSLIYFIPKYPELERQSVTHTVLLMLGTSLIGIAVLYLLRGVILAKANWDFVVPLMLFLFFSLNFDFFENYLLGKKRPDFVLFYSSGRTVVRTVALIVTAYVTRDVADAVRALIAVEAAKGLFVVIALRRVFTRKLDRALLGEQLRFILPLGSANTIDQINGQLANLVISVKMGLASLAAYTNGSYQIPIVNVVRSSIMDVLFPEMAQIDDASRLHLWRRANIAFCFLIFPVYVVFLFYATTVILTLFPQYARSVPLFRIYLTMILIQCFDMGSPLRTINQNKYFILGSVLALCSNIGLMLLLFSPVGFLLPAFAFIAGQLVAVAYLAQRIMHFYRVRMAELFMWGKIVRLLGAAALPVPLLFASLWVHMEPVAKAVLFSLLYMFAYYLAARRFRIEEVEVFVEKFLRRIRRPAAVT